MALTSEQIQNSFWAHRPESNFPPDAINYPDEFTGGSSLNLICTQLDLSSYRQRKLVEEWCAILPRITSLQFLWINSRTNQALFEAACEIIDLRGLFIDWGSVNDLEPLSNLKLLKYLHIGSSPSIESINPIRSLDQLVVLHIENFKRIQDLKPLGDLTNLEGLAVEGSMWTIQVVESLLPLGSLKNLLYLFLGNLKSLDRSLKPLIALKRLENLVIGYNWPIREMRLLKNNLPNLQFGSLLNEEFIEKFGIPNNN